MFISVYVLVPVRVYVCVRVRVRFRVHVRGHDVNILKLNLADYLNLQCSQKFMMSVDQRADAFGIKGLLFEEGKLINITKSIFSKYCSEMFAKFRSIQTILNCLKYFQLVLIISSIRFELVITIVFFGEASTF
jgi:hypothetical protein